MNAKDEKAGKTTKLPAEKAVAVNKLLKEEAAAPPPAKTVELVDNARNRKKNK
jgi:hypothetical protein